MAGIVLCCDIAVADEFAGETEFVQQRDTLSDVAATYRIDYAGTRASEQVDTWIFWRHGRYVEIRTGGDDFGEAWELIGNGRTVYRWFSHGERFAVRHDAVPAAESAERTWWDDRATLISRADLLKLQRRSDESYDGMPAQVFSGDLNGVHTTVAWLPQWQLPGRIERRLTNGTVTLSLTSVQDFEAATQRPRNTDTYQEIDYADFGDRAADPLVQMYLRLLSQGLVSLPPGVH